MKRRSSIDQFRENLRLQQIYSLMLSFVVDFAIDRGIFGDFRRRMQEWLYDPPYKLVPLSMPVKIRVLLQELGPTYVKLGQLVSSQAQALPPEWEKELAKLQANVPPFPYEEVHEIIVDELGAPPHELFETFEEEPLAAASTAQVHKATLFGGQLAVVKVQRPNIRTQVKADLGILDNAVRVVNRRSAWARDLGLAGILDEFGSNVMMELDYRGEAYNARRLARNMESIPGVHIPIIYSDLSTSRVMTMEFIRGVKVTNIAAIEEAGLDRPALAEVTIRSLIKQLLVDGFFHADPHPGNVIVNLETGQLNYLDLGMVGELDVNQRINLINLLMVVRDNDVQGLAQVLRNLSKPFRAVDERGYNRVFERRVGRYLEPGSGGSFTEAVNVGLSTLLEFGMRLDPQLTLALKALMQLEAITTALDPTSGVVAMGYHVTQQLVVEQITPENVADVVKKQAALSLREVIQRVPSLQEATVRWLDQYQKGRFEVYVDTSQLANELKKTRSWGSQAILGIILVGMLVGSAIATNNQTFQGTAWEWLQRFALIGYTFAMVVAIIFVLGLLWRLWRRSGQDDRDS